MPPTELTVWWCHCPQGLAQAPRGHSTRPYTTLLDRFCHLLHCQFGGATALKGWPNHPGARAPVPIQNYETDSATHCTYSLVVPLAPWACTGTQGAIAPVPVHNYWIDFATHCTANLVVPLPSRAGPTTQGPEHQGLHKLIRQTLPPTALTVWWCNWPHGLAQAFRGHSTSAYTQFLDRFCHPLRCQFGGATAHKYLPKHPVARAPGPIHNY